MAGASNSGPAGLSGDLVRRIAGLISAGRPIKTVAREVGVSRGVVRQIARGEYPVPLQARCPDCGHQVELPCRICATRRLAPPAQQSCLQCGNPTRDYYTCCPRTGRPLRGTVCCSSCYERLFQRAVHDHACRNSREATLKLPPLEKPAGRGLIWHAWGIATAAVRACLTRSCDAPSG